MAIPRISIRNFLAQARDRLRAATERRQNITLVVGNESADLDSLTSSLLLAYIRSQAPPQDAFSSVYVPVTNIPFRDIQLRPEFAAVLRHGNLDAQHLITLDDLIDPDSKPKLDVDQTRWILVDHNALAGKLGSVYSQRVCGVIDHHAEEHKVPTNTGDEPRIITKSGSCTSLVVNYCRGTWDALSRQAANSGAAHARGDAEAVVDGGSASKLWDGQLAKLALASILIDTHNLAARDRVTEHDVSAVDYLEAKITAAAQTAATFQRPEYFEEIDNAKKDVSELSVNDMLRKDYKEWTEATGCKLGISSVVKPLEFLVERATTETEEEQLRRSEDSQPALIGAIQQFARERRLDMYAVMTTSTSPDGEFQRQLLVRAYTESGMSAARNFSESARSQLGLREWHGSDGSLNDGEVDDQKQWGRAWCQGRVDHSRKQVAPLLREAMRRDVSC